MIGFIIALPIGAAFMLYILFGSEANEKPKSEVRKQLEAGFAGRK